MSKRFGGIILGCKYRTSFIDPLYLSFLKKNQNVPRPSEHPPVREEKMSKRLGGIKVKAAMFLLSFLPSRSRSGLATAYVYHWARLRPDRLI